MRKDIAVTFQTVSGANDILAQLLGDDKKAELAEEVYKFIYICLYRQMNCHLSHDIARTKYEAAPRVEMTSHDEKGETDKNGCFFSGRYEFFTNEFFLKLVIQDFPKNIFPNGFFLKNQSLG